MFLNDCTDGLYHVIQAAVTELDSPILGGHLHVPSQLLSSGQGSTLNQKSPSQKGHHPKNCQVYMGVSKNVVPQNGWFIMENPIKMDDLRVPLFSETSICVFILYMRSKTQVIPGLQIDMKDPQLLATYGLYPFPVLQRQGTLVFS